MLNRLKDKGLRDGVGHNLFSFPVADELANKIHFVKFPLMIFYMMENLQIQTIRWSILPSLTRWSFVDLSM